MSNDRLQLLQTLWLPIIASVGSSLVVGMASAYLTVNVALARVEKDVESSRRQIQENSRMIEKWQNDRDRLIRMEAKVDLMLVPVLQMTRETPPKE